MKLSNVKFKAKLTDAAKDSVIENMHDFMNANLQYEDGYIIGNLVMDEEQPYFVGDIVESTAEYINFEWWLPVQKDTIEIISDDIKQMQKQIDDYRLAESYSHSHQEMGY